MTAVPRLDFVQNCYVVRNLEQACRQFHDLYGIGPFVGGSEALLEQHFYRGQPAQPIHLRGVFAQSGELNIELVEILSDGPCAFTEMFARGSGGLHHAAIFSEDYYRDRDRMIAAGMPLVSEFTVPFGATICYLDARNTLGHMIELYPENAVIRDMYRQASDAARSWDGRNLIVPWR